MKQMKITISLLLIAFVTHGASAGEIVADQQADRMQWWREARFGMFIHWGLYSVAGGEWEGKRCETIGSWMMHEYRISPKDYESLLPGFTAERYDPEAWAQLAKSAGMQYAVFTAKHHEGFCLFETKHTDFNVMNSPAKRDVTREYLDAFRDAGLRAGLYYSLIDWHHPQYPVKGDELHPMRDNPAYLAEARDLNKYNDFMHAQVRDLLTKYGQIDVMWWDFSYGSMHGEAWRTSDLNKMRDQLQPAMVMNNRTHKDSHLNAEGDFATAEQHVPPNGIPGLDWETCMTINDTWGYKPHDLNYKSSITLIRTLIDVVSKGGNFLLNVGPKADGSIPEPLIERLEAIGKWMDKNGESIHASSASPFTHPLPWGRVTTKEVGDGRFRLYLHVFDWPISREIVLPPLDNEIRSVHLLDGASELQSIKSGAGTVISLPLQPRHEAATVIVVELEGKPKPGISTIGPNADGAYQLEAGSAKLHGSVLAYPSGSNEQSIGNWTRIDEWVSWKLNVPQAGRYRVNISYGCDDGSGGTYRISVADHELTAAVNSTGGWFVRKTESPGTLELPAGKDIELSIKITELKGLAVMDLKSIQLVPAE